MDMGRAKINFEIPADILFSLNETAQEFSNQMRLYSAVLLFKDEKLTLKQSADLANAPMMNFIYELGKRDIPVINYSPEELEDEVGDL